MILEYNLSVIDPLNRRLHLKEIKICGPGIYWRLEDGQSVAYFQVTIFDIKHALYILAKYNLINKKNGKPFMTEQQVREYEEKQRDFACTIL